MDAKNIVSNYRRLQSDRTDVEVMWNFMEDYVLPYRSDKYGNTDTNGSVEWRKRTIYDMTAVEACDALSASLQGNLISPATRWFDMAFSDDEVNKDGEARRWIEECAEVIFNTLQSSNFNLEAAESITDLVGFGTMALLEEVNDKDEIVFTAAPIEDIYFELGAYGQVLRFYRRLKWTALQIRDKFGEEMLSDEMKDEIEKGSSTKHELVFCIYHIPENADNNTSKVLAVDARPYGFKYVNAKTQEVYKKGGYYEQPSFITRWKTTSNSVWGNAPGFKCLAAILDINEMKQLVLEEAALSIEPPLMTTARGIISDLERQRAGLTIVNNVNEIMPLPGRGDANLAMIDLEVLRGQIRRAFYEDQLQLKDSPAMTATEVNVRYELMQRLLGPTMGRLKVEFLDPLITRTFAILHRLGKLPPAPESVIESGSEYNVEYLGPLPRSQKLETARSIAGFIGQIGSLREAFPGIEDVIDIDAAARDMGILGGVPAKHIRTEKAVKKLRDDRAKAEAQRAQASQIKEAGEAASAAAQGVQDMQALPPQTIEAMQQSLGFQG